MLLILSLAIRHRHAALWPVDTHNNQNTHTHTHRHSLGACLILLAENEFSLWANTFICLAVIYHFTGHQPNADRLVEDRNGGVLVMSGKAP